jgi:flagella basal body P-ring formation protein FlgA
MKRIIAFAALVAFTNPAPAQLATISSAPALKSDVTVSGEVVRIGDLVEHAGAVANIAVFRAPDPGNTGSVPIERVLDALRPHDVIALDTRGLTDVKVTRTSRAITAQDIEAKIAQEIAVQLGVRDVARIGVTFDREPVTLHVDAGLTGPLQTARLGFDRRSGRFDAQIEIPAGGKRNAMRFTGTAAEVFEAAVLTRPVARGEILRPSDVAIERRPKTEIQGDAIADTAVAIGQAARRALRPGTALRQGDLQRPEIVQRNEPVLILYQVPGISLTLRGKALDSGAEGDVVNVLNIQSKRTVQGTVSGSGRVTVSAPVARVAANLSGSNAGAQSR